MQRIAKYLIDNYLNWQSFKTDNPIVVIESDDWGSLRTKDLATRNHILKLSDDVQKDNYTRLDSIATEADLQALFEVLNSVRDSKGSPACITANVCTANPNFRAIKASDFKEFHYVPFTDNLKQYSSGNSLFEIWREGESASLFKPQLHGREHLHALAWLTELNKGNKALLKAFELESWGIPYKAKSIQRRANLQAALDEYGLAGEQLFHINWIEDSVKIFESTFGYKSKSFVAPAYVWNAINNKTLSQNGIKSLQGIKLQYEPFHNSETRYSKKLRYIGQRDIGSGLIYTTRNVFLEVHRNPNEDWVARCMSLIHKTIKSNKPVIISSHRINFVGRLETTHRDISLKALQTILKNIVKAYPTVEFLNSAQLADRLHETKSYKI